VIALSSADLRMGESASRDPSISRTPAAVRPEQIRNFGFLANRKRATLLPLCFHLLGSAQEPQAEQHASSTEDSPDLWRCPKCGGPMKVIERLTAAEIQLRSPPVVSAAA
jgi:rubredoxin